MTKNDAMKKIGTVTPRFYQQVMQYAQIKAFSREANTTCKYNMIVL